MGRPQEAVRIREGVDSALVDGQVILLEPTDGRYLSLDEVGTRIWELIQEDGRIESILNTLQEEFDVTEERLQRDVQRFLSRCEELRLVERYVE
ncbi:MAG: PqqD family protein [bacterium]